MGHVIDQRSISVLVETCIVVVFMLFTFKFPLKVDACCIYDLYEHYVKWRNGFFLFSAVCKLVKQKKTRKIAACSLMRRAR